MKIRQMSIGEHIRLVLTVVALLGFLTLGVLSVHFFGGVWQNTQERSEQLSEATRSFMEEVATSQTKEHLKRVAAERARQVELELETTKENTQFLANAMTKILTNSELYKPRQLPTFTPQLMVSGKVYLLITPAVYDECQGEYARREIALASNIADLLEETSQFYEGYRTSCYIGSKYGYFIGQKKLKPDDSGYIQPIGYSDNFDPRERPWYKLVAESGSASFTEVYTSVDGITEITCAAPYYDSDGLAGVAGFDIPLDSLYNFVSGHSAGNSNINFALDSNGRIIFSTETKGELAVNNEGQDLRKSSDERVAKEATKMMEGASDVAIVEMNGEEYYLAYAPMPSLGWSFGTLLKKTEVTEPIEEMRNALAVQTNDFGDSMRGMFIETAVRTTLVLVVMFALILYGSRKTAKRFVQPILTLTDGVGEIAKGNFDKKLDIKTGDEIETLSGTINNMTAELKEYIADIERVMVEEQRISAELSLAQGIQEGMLPKIFPKFSGNPHYDIYAEIRNIKEVGADFYDFYMIDEKYIALTMADVAGKGVPAALFMVITKTMLKNNALTTAMEKGTDKVDWSSVVERVNRQLCANNEEMMFVRVFFGVLNILTGDLVYVNGGHNAPLIGRVTEGKTVWQYIKDNNKPRVLGVIENAKYETRQLKLNPGDMLYLYTEGVTGTVREDGNSYTEERLLETLDRVSASSNSMKEMITAVYADFDNHIGSEKYSDDTTMLGIRFHG